MQHYVKNTIISLLFSTIFLSQNSYAKGSQLIPIEAKIVGGEAASENDWPWMSALVYTFNEVSTKLTVNSVNYESQNFTDGASGNVTGDIIDCGTGDTPCSNATGKICLIERGDINFSVKVENCEAGGGIGAIIYNNQAGSFSGSLSNNFSGTIPAVSITQADGLTLKANIGETATLNVADEVALTQLSTCGASFIGDKWLLTASHCVDGVSLQQLKVNVGEYDLSNGAENAKTIKRIYMHPDYQLDIELDNDIALIELVNSVNNTAISLVNLADTNQHAIDNSAVTVIGWGGREGYEPTAGPTSNFPDVLQQVDLQLLTNDDCKTTLAQSYTDNFFGTFTADDIGVTDAMICAYIPGGGKGSCQGDSGSPLMINTNLGWQQIGLVSWGAGCAADGFPGVYTRTALFSDWINEITNGIAIDQTFNFSVQAQGDTQTAELNVINNSAFTTSLTFAIDGDSNFSVANHNCTAISPESTCVLQVNYDAVNIGEHSATIRITADNNAIATSSTRVLGQTISLSEDIKTQLSSSDNALTWFSGGNSRWQVDNTEAAIVSGNITNNQKSIVMVTVPGEGQLSFEWAVSSEENTDNPDQPYDALYLYIDGELINFISGEITYESQTIELTAGEHNITWIYEKDHLASAGDDNAHLRNVVYTPVNATTSNTANSSSSGGSIEWFSLLILIFTRLYRK